MRRMTKYPILSLLIFMSAILATRSALAQEDLVRARIGITVQSGEKTWTAKARDHLKTGDLLRISIHPEVPAYIYVIHTDRRTATRLFHRRVASAEIVLPPGRDSYRVDGESPVEIFYVICSLDPQKGIADMPGTGMAHEDWVPIEEKLVKQGKMDLSQRIDKPFSIAGTMRGTPSGPSIPTTTGHSLIIKKYEFSVKK